MWMRIVPDFNDLQKNNPEFLRDYLYLICLQSIQIIPLSSKIKEEIKKGNICMTLPHEPFLFCGCKSRNNFKADQIFNKIFYIQLILYWKKTFYVVAGLNLPDPSGRNRKVPIPLR